MNDDLELLRAYAERQSEPAFETLVRRHLDLVYSAALRQARQPALAEEITQTVFIILARKAGSISSKTILPGWLYRTTRYAAAAAMKMQRRREMREQEAHMQSLIPESQSEPDWDALSPLLDDAMAQLSDQDRDALVLRYFQNKNLRDVGAALGVDEYAAQKRVSRALDRLHRYFVRRGISSTTAIVAGAISANSIHAAPAALAKTISAAALAKGAAASASTLTLIKGALKIMAWTKMKTAIVTGAIVLFAAGTATVTVKEIQRQELQGHEDSQWDTGQLNSVRLQSAPHIVRIIPTKFPAQRGWIGVDGNKIGFGSTAQDIVRSAYGGAKYGASATRVIFFAPVSNEKFDFIANLPTGSDEALQREAKKKFGVAGRFETFETNVLFLKLVTRDAPGLKPASKQNTSSSRDSGNQFEMTDTTVDSVANYLEGQLGIPVVEQTGLSGSYDIRLKWDPRNDPEHEILKRAVRDQLGLDLVPGTAPIKMLVVEKAK